MLDEVVTPDMINFALETEAEQAAWDMWISIYPHFTDETFMPFDRFLKSSIKRAAQTILKSNEEIMEEMDRVVKHYEENIRGREQ